MDLAPTITKDGVLVGPIQGGVFKNGMHPSNSFDNQKTEYLAEFNGTRYDTRFFGVKDGQIIRKVPILVIQRGGVGGGGRP